MNTILQKFLAVAIVVVALPVTSLAMPVVTGNTLSWPDDGWYQVQRADTFETICEGIVSADASVSGGPCVLGDVNHIVINHTTGQRFENIVAVDSSTSANTVLVEGGRITWPDDGWYQVQNANTLATVCEGGRECDVATGSYHVINLTSGERFESVFVRSDFPNDGNSNPAADGVTVSGQIISWPNNGWYQVQDAANFSTVCEGGASCMVQSGSYIVINHSTGERFNDIEIGPDSSTGGSEGNNIPASVVVDGTTIRWPDNGWYQVQNPSSFASVCEGGTECEVSPGTFIIINHTNGERTTVDVAGNSTTGDPAAEDITRVQFNITVPVYQSNSLQVRLTWGDREFTGRWNRDELWTVSAELPIDTDGRLVVAFNDRNGEITLGSFETDFRTGTNLSDSFQISAEQFNTNRWDSDGDGISNLDELTQGRDPLIANQAAPPTSLPQAVEATLELVPGKTFRISWQQSAGADFYRVLENPDGISGFMQIGYDLEPSALVFNHRVAVTTRPLLDHRPTSHKDFSLPIV